MSNPDDRTIDLYGTASSNLHHWRRFEDALTITCSITLFISLLAIGTFFVLLANNPSRMSIPLLKLTTSIQAVNVVALIITMVLGEVEIRPELLCSSLRYMLYICYLSSIFMSCSVTIHLWLVISCHNLEKARRNERWYYIIPFALAFTLSAIFASLPNSVYGLTNRCGSPSIPLKRYLVVRWCLYYSWFIISAIISIVCMVSVLRSARRLTHVTLQHSSRHAVTADDYRDEVNTRANSSRLRSLVVYTIAYPVIVLLSNIPQLIYELLSTVAKKKYKAFFIASRVMLYSQGFFLSLAFFALPAVRHSAKEMNHAAVQYWVIEQEEFWRMKKNPIHRGSVNIRQQEIGDFPTDEQDEHNFTSLRGRLYHFFLCQTPEGRLARTL